jgi:hypothetical protein
MAGQRSPVFIADDRVIALGDDPNRHFLKNTFFVTVLLFGHIGQRRRIVRRASRLSSPIPTACRSLGADFENFRRPILMYASLATTSSDSFQLLH